MPDDGEDLPPEATVILHVSGGKTLPRPRPADCPCEHIDADALRCDDDGISVTWVEFFPGDEREQLRAASLAMKGPLTIRKSGVIARITVQKLLEAVSDESCDLRVVRDRQDHNEGHCLITGVSPADIGLLMVLADAFEDFVPAAQIPGLVA